MTAVVVLLAIAAVAAAGTATALAIRMGGIREELAETEAARLREVDEREEAVEAMELATKELATERSRYIATDQRRARELHAVEERLNATMLACRDPKAARDRLADVLKESES